MYKFQLYTIPLISDNQKKTIDFSKMVWKIVRVNNVELVIAKMEKRRGIWTKGMDESFDLRVLNGSLKVNQMICFISINFYI